MKLSHVLKIGSYLILLGSLISCGSKEDEEVQVDQLIGSWEGSCGRMLTTAEIEAECGLPRDSNCEEKYAKYYHKISAKFIEASNVNTTARHPQVTYTLASYFNEDAEVAATCASSDKVATFAVTKNYQVAVTHLDSTTEVTTENGFPENAEPINFQTTSYTRTYHHEAVIDQLNTYDVCEFNDWEVDIAKDVSLKENCVSSLFAYTDRFGEQQQNLVDFTYGADGNWDSHYVPGQEQFSIYFLDTTVSPKTLQLGKQEVDDDGSFTDDQIKEARQKDGSSDVHRMNILDAKMVFAED